MCLAMQSCTSERRRATCCSRSISRTAPAWPGIDRQRRAWAWLSNWISFARAGIGSTEGRAQNGAAESGSDGGQRANNAGLKTAAPLSAGGFLARATEQQPPEREHTTKRAVALCSLRSSSFKEQVRPAQCQTKRTFSQECVSAQPPAHYTRCRECDSARIEPPTIHQKKRRA